MILREIIFQLANIIVVKGLNSRRVFFYIADKEKNLILELKDIVKKREEK